MGVESEFTDMVYNSVNAVFRIDKVIIEGKESKKLFLKRRIKKLGVVKVAGQVLFQLTVPKYLNMISKKRRNEIIEKNALDLSPIPHEKIVNVSSVNTAETATILKNLQPDLIIVNGTRIITQKILDAAGCSFINTHMGITPQYRGAHGMYWALLNKDGENSGTTVHFVDKGIDTGNIIAQEKTSREKKDNFTTYPLLQIAAGIKILIPAISDYFSGSVERKKNDVKGNLWYNPTLWQYIYGRITKGVK